MTGPVRRRVAGVLWVLTVGYFVVQPVAAAAWPAGYSWRRNYISDLGVTTCGPDVCSPAHAVMNGGFVGTGVLIVAGTVLLWPDRPRRRPVTAGLVLVVIGGLGTVVVGLFPADVSLPVHGLAALVHIPLQNVGVLLLGLGLVGRARPFGVWTLVCAVAGLVGTIAFFGGLDGPLGVGGTERLADYPFVAWFVVTGIVVLQRAGPGLTPAR